MRNGVFRTFVPVPRIRWSSKVRKGSLRNFFTFLYHTILLGYRKIERYHPKSLCYRGGTFETRISSEAEVHPNYLLSKVADQHRNIGAMNMV